MVSVSPTTVFERSDVIEPASDPDHVQTVTACGRFDLQDTAKG